VPNCLQCGQGRGSVPPPSVVPDRLQVNGIYQLGSYPGCADAYNGEHREVKVYVIGFRTPDERLFKRADKAAAVTYYNSFGGTLALWHDFAGNFCNQAMLDLFA
jgi:hypothetical protein